MIVARQIVYCTWTCNAVGTWCKVQAVGRGVILTPSGKENVKQIILLFEVYELLTVVLL